MVQTMHRTVHFPHDRLGFQGKIWIKCSFRVRPPYQLISKEVAKVSGYFCFFIHPGKDEFGMQNAALTCAALRRAARLTDENPRPA
jgi:hypothetical protein